MTLRSGWKLGAVALVAAGALGLWIAQRERTPPLTRDALEKARSAWKSRAPGDYDITIQKDVDARPSEVIRTEVRGGKPRRLVLNGHELEARDSYSVPGLLDTCAEELNMSASKDPLPGQPANAVLLARFEEQLGVPLVIKRIASNRQSYILRVLKVEIPGGQVFWKDP